MMKYIKIIEEQLPAILDDISRQIRDDETLREMTQIQRLDELLKEQQKVLYRFFMEYSEDESKNEYFWNFYKEFNVPFSIVYKSLNTLKIKLLKELFDKIDDKGELFLIENFINNLLNMIAKIYIQKDIENIATMQNSKFQKYLLFKVNHKWLTKLVSAIKDEDLDNYPLVSAKECQFTEVLSFPESLMICLDENLSDYLHSVHENVHKSANTLYLFYKKEEYYQAYMVYKELLENVMNLTKTITELYFLTYNNLEERFFKLIELLLYQKSDIYLTLIDIKKLKSLNTTYGELTMNSLLKEVDSKLQAIVHQRQKDILLIRGVTADYYMLNIGLKQDEMSAINKELYQIVNKTYRMNHKEVEISSTIVTLSLDGFYEKNRDELTKMMLYLKAKAKQAQSSYQIDNADDKKEILEWLEASYNDINFINEKLHKEQIDVVFQPIHNIKTQKIEIVEALVRIKDQNRLIPAGAFIDTIYNIEKIELLDRLVLEKILEKKRDIQSVVSTLFINVSYKSFFDLKYMKVFEHFIKEFEGYDVVFELTEQNIVENIDEILKLHKKYNIHFAVDDFGSGYSSLKTVADLAREGVLKVLKMDGEIIKNINKDCYIQKIIRVIAELSTTLELLSVAEFIENQEVLDLLEGFEVTYAQGFYLSKPQSIEELLVAKLNGLLSF